MSGRWQCSAEEITVASHYSICIFCLWVMAFQVTCSNSDCLHLSSPFFLLLHSCKSLQKHRTVFKVNARSERPWSLCLADLTLPISMWTTVYLKCLLQTCDHGARSEWVQSSVVLGSHTPAWMIGSTFLYRCTVARKSMWTLWSYLDFCINWSSNLIWSSSKSQN